MFVQTWRSVIAIALLANGASCAWAADWPQFRGVGGSGVASEATPPLEWSDSKNLKWKTALPGAGSSSPILVGDAIFVTYYKGVDGSDAGKLVRGLACLSRSDGKELWKVEIPSTAKEDSYTGYITEHGYASGTPVSDGEAVYAFLGKSGVLACDLKGNKLWQTNVGTESDIRRWGSGASPILFNNLVIINAASESQSVRALDKKTGKEVWKAPGSRLSLSFGTPAIVKVSDERSDLVIAPPGEVWGLNPTTGKLIWYASIRSDGNVSPSIVAGDGVVYVTGGFTGKGTTAIRVGGKGDVTKTHVIWSIKASSYVPTPLLHDNRLYWVNEDGLALCVDATTGKSIYEERLAVQGGGRGGKPFYASLVLGGKTLYAVSRKAGTFAYSVGDKFDAPVRSKLMDDTDFNATPAIAGKQLYIKSNKALYCLENAN